MICRICGGGHSSKKCPHRKAHYDPMWVADIPASVPEGAEAIKRYMKAHNIKVFHIAGLKVSLKK